MHKHRYYVYILTNERRTVLYTGVTGDLARRLEAHRSKPRKGFAARYNADILVHVEIYDYVHQAIAREKCIKGGSRAKKISLIESGNSAWNDLSVVL